MGQSSILIVDDDDAVRIVASEMLRSLDCEVTLADGGIQALAALERNGFDLVLLDVGMPVMSGVEVYAELRQLYPSQRVAFMTGYTEEEISDLESERTSILTKPFSLKHLAELLQTVQ